MVGGLMIASGGKWIRKSTNGQTKMTNLEDGQEATVECATYRRVYKDAISDVINIFLVVGCTILHDQPKPLN